MEAYLIVKVELGGNIVSFETGKGSSTRKHLYAYDNIGAARRQLNIMNRRRMGAIGVTEECYAIAVIKGSHRGEGNTLEILYK